MKRKINLSLLVGMGVIVLLSGCVKQGEYDSLQAQLSTQNQQLQQLQPGMADTYAQMQMLQQDVALLKGEIDTLNSMGGARGMVSQLEKHKAALEQVENKFDMNFNLDSPMYTAGTVYTAPTVPMNAIPSVTRTPVTTASPPALPNLAPPAPVNDSAASLFNAGVTAFNGRQYAQAQSAFVNFTEQHPDNPEISKAWYYIGECNFQLNKYNEAAVAYDRVISDYSSSSAAPGAYLKQAISFSKLGQEAAAQARMQELIRMFPSSSEAAQATTFLETNQL